MATNRKRLTDTQDLRGQIEYITMSALREAPGDVLTQVQMGKVSLNAKRGFGWVKNPYVWVVNFKRVQ